MDEDEEGERRTERTMEGRTGGNDHPSDESLALPQLCLGVLLRVSLNGDFMPLFPRFLGIKNSANKFYPITLLSSLFI